MSLHRVRVPLPAGMNEAWRGFGVMVQSFGPIRVSRYKLITEPGIYHGTESKLRALVRSPGEAIIRSRYKKAVSSKTVTNK